MLKTIEFIRFELVYHLKKPSTWLIFFSVIGLTFLVLTEIIDYSRTIGGVIINAPVTIAEISSYSNLFGLLLVAAIVGSGGMRDHRTRMAPLIFTSSITKAEYLFGRLLGLYFVSSLLILAVLPCSLLLAHFLLNIENDLYGPFRMLAFTKPLFYFTLPNVFIATTLAFAGTLYFRNVLGAYLGILLYFICCIFGSSLIGQWSFAGIIDPSGRVILDSFRLTLSPSRINLETVEFSFLLLANRVLWFYFSFLILFLTSRIFRFSELPPRLLFIKRRRKSVEFPDIIVQAKRKLPQAVIVFDLLTRARQFKYLSLQYFNWLILSRTGLFLPASVLLFFFLIPKLIEGPYEVAGIPTTEVMISTLEHPVVKILIIFSIIIFSGQFIWRERDFGSNEIVDSAPVSNALLILSKFAGIGLLIAFLQGLLVGAGILFQIFSGLDDIGITDYSIFYITETISYWIFAAAVFFIHILVNQKILANFLGILFYLYTLRPDLLNMESRLWVYGSHPGLGNSIFYSQSTFFGPWLLYMLYWGGWAILLLWLSVRLSDRGVAAGLQERLRRPYLKLKSSKLIYFPVLLSLLTGILILYNTHYVHEFLSSAERTDQKVLYESLYGKHKNIPQPHLVGTHLAVELYSEDRQATVDSRYILKNGTDQTIETIHVTTMPGVETINIKFNVAATLAHKDTSLGYLIFRLKEPMKVGSIMEMDFELIFNNKGFRNSGLETSIMENGSQIDNLEWFPAIGYQEDRELTDNYKRKKNVLPEKGRSLPLDSSKLYSRRGQETITFEAEIGTSAGQLAVAPGTLLQSWKKNGRNYFHYSSQVPILNRYKIFSANYQVKRSSWENVLLEIYHHPANAHNLERIEEAAKATLSYGSKNFGSYPFSQLKFVEYPDPGTGAFAFPGLIQYSPKFVLNRSEKEKLDVVFAAAAHEVGHQWWGHKILPAPVDGSAFLVESLAWYTSFGAIESRYGPDHLNRLLDAMRKEYHNPRSKAGTSLLLTNSELQAYRKGPFAMYALREYVGEEKISQALRQLIRKFQSGHPPYPTSYDLYQELKMVTPDSLQYLLKDLLAENTYWTLSTTNAKVLKTKEDQWRLELEIYARKITADIKGVETEQPVDDLMEIGIFGAVPGSPPLYLRKHKLVSGYNLITVEVSEAPFYAGVDPRNLLIDTEVNDNIIKVYSNNKEVYKSEGDLTY